MKEYKPIDANELIREAEKSHHKEAYTLLDRNLTFRIGVGARADSSNAPTFFMEIIISLCPNSAEADLQNLEKTLEILKALRARKYSLIFQDDNRISCEKTLPKQSIPKEYEAVKSLMTRSFL